GGCPAPDRPLPLEERQAADLPQAWCPARSRQPERRPDDAGLSAEEGLSGALSGWCLSAEGLPPEQSWPGAVRHAGWLAPRRRAGRQLYPGQLPALPRLPARHAAAFTSRSVWSLPCGTADASDDPSCSRVIAPRPALDGFSR